MFTKGVGPVANFGSGFAVAVTLNGCTAGRHLIVGVFSVHNTTPTNSVVNSVSCSGEADLTLAGNRVITTNNRNRVTLAYLPNITAGGNKTIQANFNGSASFAEIFAVEFAGGDVAAFFDKLVSFELANLAPSIDIVTAFDNSLVIGLVASNSNLDVYTAGADYTLINLASESYWKGEYDLDAGAAGTKTVNFGGVGTPARQALLAAAFNVMPPATPVNIDASLTFGMSAVVGGPDIFAQALDIVSPVLVQNKLEIDSVFLQQKQQALEISYPLTKTVQAQCEVGYPILAVTVVQNEVTIGYPLVDLSGVVVTSNPTVTIKGQTFPLYSARVDADEGQYAWTCSLELADAAHYSLFNEGDDFSVNLGGEVYQFVVDTKQFSRGGQVDLSATVSGISPSARYSDTMGVPLTKTWPAVTARAVADELFGVGAVQWGILNWLIPDGVLAVSDQSKIGVLQLIAQAAGGVVETDPDGTVRVRYLYPVSVRKFKTAVADQQYEEAQHSFSSSERTTDTKVVNKLRVMDGAFSSQSDGMEFRQSEENPVEATVKVVPSPWRETLFVTHTSKPEVSVTPEGTATEELEETVEVIEGKGSVSKPIHQVLAVEWLYANLGSVQSSPDKSEFTTTVPGESLVRITYTTRFLSFKAVAFPEAEVQFLAKEEEGSAGAGVDVVVQRNAGNVQGEDVVDPLITSTAVALARGRNELDEQAHGMLELDVVTLYRTGVRCGQLARFVDSRSGEAWVGKISGIGHDVSRDDRGGVELTTRLRIRKPTVFE